MNRERKIIRASWWAVTLNAALAAMKLTVGFISGSYAVIADGIDSATDIVSSLVVLLAARSGSKDSLLCNFLRGRTTGLVHGSDAFAGGGEGNSITAGHMGNGHLHWRKIGAYLLSAQNREKGGESHAHGQCPEYA